MAADDAHAARQRVRHPRQRQEPDVEPHARLGGGAGDVRVPRARTLEQPCVLVGGLGMGFTLRATLDCLPPDATVVVAELVPAVVEWNRGPLGPLAGHPLKDRRVAVESVTSPRRCARARRASTRCCSTSTTARPRSPRRHNAGLYNDRGLAASARRSRPAACWRCGRRGTIASSSSACATRLHRRSRARARAPEEGRAAPHDLPRGQGREG